MSTDGNTRTVVMEREMAHPPEKVWRALTQSALMQEWLMTNDFQPVVGHRFKLRTQPMPHWNGVIDCEVLAVEPCTALSYAWNTAGNNAKNGLTTVVRWTLTPTAEGTLVRMEHSGFRPDEENNFRGAQYGWQTFIGSLEQVVSLLD